MYLCKATAKWHIIITIIKAIKLRLSQMQHCECMQSNIPLPDILGMGRRVSGDGTGVEAKWK